MLHSCPSCKSFNARRSKVRSSEVTLRNLFMSPYRCRRCRTRFWVLSKSSYYLGGLLVGVFVLVIVAWHASRVIDWIDVTKEASSRDHGPAFDSAARLEELLKLAQKEDPNAEYQLAQLYANGYGVPQRPQEELKWLQRAARHGNVQAQYEYGIALRDGRGTLQDYPEARKWIQLAAEASNASAQFALGQIYRTGLGIPADGVKAYAWLNVAASQGVPGASAARDGLLPRLSAAELHEAQAESHRLEEQYVPKAAQAEK